MTSTPPPGQTWVPRRHGSLYDVDNLPYAVFADASGPKRVGVRIGDHVLDLAAAAARPGAPYLPPRGRRVAQPSDGSRPGDVGRGPRLGGRPAHRSRPTRGGCRWSRWPTPRSPCPSRSATTSTTTPPSTTRPMSAGSSGLTATHSSPTGSTSRSAITAGRARSWSPEPTSIAPRDSARRPPTPHRRTARAFGSTSRPSWASSSDSPARSGSGSPPRSSPTPSSGSPASTTGRRATSRHGSTSLSAPTWRSPSRPASPPGSRRSPRWSTRAVDLPGQDVEVLPYLRETGPSGYDIEVEVEVNGTVVAVRRTRRCTGHLPRCWPTSRSTAPPCGSGTSSRPAPSPARRRSSADPSSSSPGAAANRGPPAGRSAPSSRTATRSCCATRHPADQRAHGTGRGAWHDPAHHLTALGTRDLCGQPMNPPSRPARGPRPWSAVWRSCCELGRHPRGLTTSEVASSCGLHRSITHRLLVSLHRTAFASRDADGRYTVGPAVHDLVEAPAHSCARSPNPFSIGLARRGRRQREPGRGRR